MLDIIFTLTVTVVSFVVLLSVVVFFHELGHFQVARWCGVKVDVFSIGFGKTLFSRTDKHGTNWRISVLPLGGYVKFFGDAGPASNPSADVSAEIADKTQQDNKLAGHTTNEQFSNKSEKERLEATLSPEEKAVCFHFKPLWQRAAVVAAGPIANFILAVVILMIMLMTLGTSQTSTQISSVEPNSAAAEAGLEPGDVILSVNGREVSSFQMLSQEVQLSSGDRLELKVDRAGEIISVYAEPRREEREDRYGNKVMVGFLGVGSSNEPVFKRYGPIGAFTTSVSFVGNALEKTVRFLGRIITGKEDFSQLGGPIKIAKYAGQASMVGFAENVPEEVPLGRRLLVGFIELFQLAAMISISIGFLNLLPIPVLDGGHLMFYAYEALVGEPLSENLQAISYKIGIVLMLSLMVFVSFNDVTQVFFS